MLCWAARDWPDTEQRRALVRLLFVTTSLGFLAAVSYQVQPGTPVKAAAFVVSTLVFAVAWGYFAWRSTAPRST